MSTLELFSLLVTIAAIFGYLSGRLLRLPLTIGTMVLTVAASVALLGLARFFPHLHNWAAALVGAINFDHLILHGILALLLFAGAFLLDLEALAQEKLIVTMLSVPGTILATFAAAGLMYFALPHLGIQATWLHCLFFGALISPTDPIAVLEMLRRIGVPRHVQAQLAGESLFNDGVGAVIFLTLLEASRGRAISPGGMALMLLVKAGGGILLGILGARVVSSLMRLVDAYQVEVLLTLSLATGVYALSDRLHLSAPLSAIAAGIALRRFNQRHHPSEIAHERLNSFWEVIDEVQNAVLFVLLGLEVLAIPISTSTLSAGAAAILSVSLTRVAVVSLAVTIIRVLQPGHRSSIRTLSWGGLRGGLSLALALSVPANEGRAWILCATYCVVLFSIVLQGGTMDLFLAKFGRRQA